MRRASKNPYHRAHSAIRKAKGSASAHPCVTCGGPAQGWARLTDAPPYSCDPDHYQAMCAKCHYAYDRDIHNAARAQWRAARRRRRDLDS